MEDAGEVGGPLRPTHAGAPLAGGCALASCPPPLHEGRGERERERGRQGREGEEEELDEGGAACRRRRSVCREEDGERLESERRERRG